MDSHHLINFRLNPASTAPTIYPSVSRMSCVSEPEISVLGRQSTAIRGKERQKDQRTELHLVYKSKYELTQNYSSDKEQITKTLRFLEYMEGHPQFI